MENQSPIKRKSTQRSNTRRTRSNRSTQKTKKKEIEQNLQRFLSKEEENSSEDQITIKDGKISEQNFNLFDKKYQKAATLKTLTQNFDNQSFSPKSKKTKTKTTNAFFNNDDILNKIFTDEKPSNNKSHLNFELSRVSNKSSEGLLLRNNYIMPNKEQFQSFIKKKLTQTENIVDEQYSYNTENSYIKEEMDEIEDEVSKIIYDNYQKSRNTYQDMNKYKKLIYLPFLQKYSKIIQENQLTLSKVKRYAEFIKQFKKYRTSTIEANLHIINKPINDNEETENFLFKYRQLIFEHLIQSISSQSVQEPGKYKYCQRYFQRLYNNLETNKNKVKDKKIYENLRKNLLNIYKFRKRNFYLQETLDFGVEKLLGEIKGNQLIIKIMGENTHKLTEIVKQKIKIQHNQTLRRGVFLPSGTFRKCWDILITLMVVYNVINLPLIFLERSNKTGIYLTVSDFIDLCIDGFFYIDIGLNFRTGYLNSFNTLIVDLKEIKKNYLKTWFLIDLLATIPFEIFIINGNIKLISLMKLLRVLRMGRIFKLTDNIRNEQFIQILYLVLIFFLFSHWIGCFYFVLLDYIEIAFSLSFNEIAFCIKKNKLGSDDFDSICKYIYSLYQGVLIMGVQDFNMRFSSLQNFVLIIFYILGQITFSVIFGLISTIVKRIDKSNSAFTDKMEFLNKLLNFSNISGEIRNHISLYYEYIWVKHRESIFKEEQIESVSNYLKEKIFVQKYKKIVNKLDFLIGMSSDDRLLGFFLRKIKTKVFLPFELIYQEGNVSQGLYILNRGKIIFEVKSITDLGTKEKFLFSYPNFSKKMLKNRINPKRKSKSENNLSELLVQQHSINSKNDKSVDLTQKRRRKSKSIVIRNTLKSLVQRSESLNRNPQPLNEFLFDGDKKSTDLINSKEKEIENGMNFFQRKTLPSNSIKVESLSTNFKSYFDIISLMTVSGRHWSSAYCEDFCDLYYLKIEDFQYILNENQSINEELLSYAKGLEKRFQLFSNETIFNLINIPSSRTNADLYRKGKLTKENIWKQGNEDKFSRAYSVNVPDIQNILSGIEKMDILYNSIKVSEKIDESLVKFDENFEKNKNLQNLKRKRLSKTKLNLSFN